MRVRNFETQPKTCPLNYNSQCIDTGMPKTCVFLNKENGSYNTIKQYSQSTKDHTVYVKDYALSNYYNFVSYFAERSEYKCTCDSGRNFADLEGSERKSEAICSCNQGFESDGKHCKTMCDGGFDTHDARLENFQNLVLKKNLTVPFQKYFILISN